MTALHVACEYSSLGVVRRLLAMPGIQVNADSQFGFTPLVVAAKSDHPDEEAVEALPETLA